MLLLVLNIFVFVLFVCLFFGGRERGHGHLLVCTNCNVLCYLYFSILIFHILASFSTYFNLLFVKLVVVIPLLLYVNI